MMNRRFRPTDETGHRGVTVRADYLIDRFRVRYQFGGGWACGCAEFAASNACRHTREAAGRYIAQTLIAAHLEVGAPRTLTFESGASSRASAIHTRPDGAARPAHVPRTHGTPNRKTPYFRHVTFDRS